jgi:hypothetical protein
VPGVDALARPRPPWHNDTFLTGNWPAKSMRLALAFLAVSIALPAYAEPMRVSGKLGYLSEWEIVADVTERRAEGKAEFAGPVTVRHVGVCTTGRPVEMSGEIRYRISGWIKPRMTATLSLDGTDCDFVASGPETYDGVMACEQWRGVPLSLSLNPARR